MFPDCPAALRQKVPPLGVWPSEPHCFERSAPNFLPHCSSQQHCSGIFPSANCFLFLSLSLRLETSQTSIQDVLIFLTFRGQCIVIHSYNKSQRYALFLKFILIKNFGHLLSIIRSLNPVSTATGICHASSVDCLLARFGPIQESVPIRF